FPLTPPHPTSTLFPYTTLFRSLCLRSSPSSRSPRRSHAGKSQAKEGIQRRHISVLVVGTSKPGDFLRVVSELLSEPVNIQERPRSEEHTSELQSRGHLVCRLLL